MPRGSEAWQHLEEVLKEVHDGKVYRRRGATEGGRAAGVPEVVARVVVEVVAVVRV